MFEKIAGRHGAGINVMRDVAVSGYVVEVACLLELGEEEVLEVFRGCEGGRSILSDCNRNVSASRWRRWINVGFWVG